MLDSIKNELYLMNEIISRRLSIIVIPFLIFVIAVILNQFLLASNIQESGTLALGLNKITNELVIPVLNLVLLFLAIKTSIILYLKERKRIKRRY